MKEEIEPGAHLAYTINTFGELKSHDIWKNFFHGLGLISALVRDQKKKNLNLKWLDVIDCIKTLV